MSRIDWAHWRRLTYVKYWEAAALSLGINPDIVKREPGTLAWRDRSFSDHDQKARFMKRIREVHTFAEERDVSVDEIELIAFGGWLSQDGEEVPSEMLVAKVAGSHMTSIAVLDPDKEQAALFDPVGTSQLEVMFPSEGQWTKWASKAKANGLARAREGRARFNPYRAAKWWLENQNPAQWDWTRCVRRLAKSLPARSQDSKSLLTGELE